jgi:hypothetical protein
VIHRINVALCALWLAFAPALAQMGQQPGWPPLQPAPAGGGITFTGTDAQSASPGFSSGSFASVAIGTASADRIVFACWVQHSGSGIAAPTYNGGNAFTLAAGNSTTADNVALYYANITSGTTMSVAYPGGADGVAIAVGVLKGQSGGGGATTSNAVTYTAGGAQPLSVSLTVPAGGIGIACGGFGQTGAASPTYTWTGTTSGSGDEATGVATAQISIAHSTSTGTVGVSSSTSLSFGGTMAAASMAP